jgi:hypothetical protein
MRLRCLARRWSEEEEVVTRTLRGLDTYRKRYCRLKNFLRSLGMRDINCASLATQQHISCPCSNPLSWTPMISIIPKSSAPPLFREVKYFEYIQATIFAFVVTLLVSVKVSHKFI